MILGERDSRVEITVAQTEPPTSHSAGGDVLVNVQVACRGFAGACDAWVDVTAWSAFLRELTALDHQRQGAASLESISPGELRLRLFTTDRAGHLAAEGIVGVRGARQELRLEFTNISFDPGQLPALLAELSSAAPAV